MPNKTLKQQVVEMPEELFKNHMIKATDKAVARYGLEEIHKI